MSQLRMRRWSLADLPEADPRVRRAVREDTPGVARTLTKAFGEEWPQERVFGELFDHPEVPATFVALVEGQVVAVASYQLMGEFPLAGWVHWVGADPDFVGRGLGRAVTLAVLHEARWAGKTEVGLTTDDPRLPAIRTYLALGFEPDPCDPTHPQRWAAVLDRLQIDP